MAIVEAINIPIGVTGQETVNQAANSYEDLGDAVAKTQLEAERLAHQFGINDKRTQEAIKVAGRYKQEMEQLDFAIEGARGGIDTLFRATQGVVAGFEVAAGATALFGVESEDLQRILLKVQGAMVFSQGLRDIKEFAPAMFSAAKATRTWFLSLSLLQKAFIGLGIGLFVDLVLELSRRFDNVKERTLEAAKAQQEYNDKLADLRDQIQQLDETETETIIRNLEKLAKKRKEIDDENIRLNEDRRFQETEDEKKNLQDKINANVQAGVELALEERKLQKRLREIREAEQNKVKEDSKKRRADSKSDADKEFNDWLNEQLARNEAEKNNAEFVKKRQQDAFDDEEEMFQAELERDVELAEAKIANAKYVADQEAKVKQAVADLEQKIFDESQALANAVINLVGQQSKIGKAVALAQIGADTAKALTGALANSQSATPDNVATGGLAGIAKYIGLATTILTNSKRAYDIIKAPAPTASLSGGGGGSASAAVPRFNAPTTRLPQTDEFTQVRRVYVTERDITNVQDKVRVTESLSQF